MRLVLDSQQYNFVKKNSVINLNSLIIEDVAIIEVFDDINDAFRCYLTLHRKDKTRELSFGNTKDELLVYENERIGLIVIMNSNL